MKRSHHIAIACITGICCITTVGCLHQRNQQETLPLNGSNITASVKNLSEGTDGYAQETEAVSQTGDYIAEPSATTAENIVSEETETSAENTVPEETETPAVQTVGELMEVDFQALQEENEDICAWLEIPNLDISFPIVQHPTDDTYYLNHNVNHEKDIYGAIFIDTYNLNDFTDPMTVVYGHTSVKGRMFGPLQAAYSNSETFEECSIINVYLPDGVRQYRVFAAVQYSPIYLLYYYDMSRENVFKAVIDDVYKVRTLNSNKDYSERPNFGDRLLVLSTCVQGDSSHRYLIFAKEIVNTCEE